MSSSGDAEGVTGLRFPCHFFFVVFKTQYHGANISMESSDLQKAVLKNCTLHTKQEPLNSVRCCS